MPTLDVRMYNLLLGLAWLGTLDRDEIRRLWFPDRSDSTVKKTLTTMAQAKLIAPCRWSVHDTAAGVTRPQPVRWMLTPSGHAEIKPSDQYPTKPCRVRGAKLLPHDVRTTAAIVRLVELAQPYGVCGVFVAHEVHLHPEEPKPICDALLVLQLNQRGPTPLLPWSNDPAIDDEERLRFSIEADNDTEPLAVIRAKGATYNGMHTDPEWSAWWEAHYGPPPHALWIAPTAARAAAIHQQWLRACPNGGWWITDDAGLRANSWQTWHYRTLRTEVQLSFAPEARLLGAQGMRATAPAPRTIPPPVNAAIPAPPAAVSAPPAPLAAVALPPSASTMPPRPTTPTATQVRSAAPPRPMTINPSAQPPARVVVPAVLPSVPPRAIVSAAPSVEPSIGMLAVRGLVWLLKGLLWLLLAPLHLFRAVQNDGSIEAVVLFLISAITAIIMGVWWLWFGPSDWLWHALHVLTSAM